MATREEMNIMKIRGIEVKGIKKTVGKYNKMPIDERKSFNIWFDNITKEVMLIRNDICEQTGMRTEQYTDDYFDISFLRYVDVSDLIIYEYPYFDEVYKNISMAMLEAVIATYIL